METVAPESAMNGLDPMFNPEWYLTEEQLGLLERLRKVCEDTIRPLAAENDRTLTFPRKSLEALAPDGFLGLMLPKEWGGLGQNHVMYAATTETIARYGGQLPDDARALRTMRGIGRYTAGAILSFAYGRDAAIVDTNVRRVLSRVFLGARRSRRLRGQKAIWELAQSLVPKRRAYDYNQALMDFGATWCTARAPRCGDCSMRRLCVSYPAPGSRRGRDNGHA